MQGMQLRGVQQNKILRSLGRSVARAERQRCAHCRSSSQVWGIRQYGGRCRTRIAAKSDTELQAGASDAEGEVPEKLFSTLEYTDEDEAVHNPGSVFGAAALVAGTTVGAGILAVPFVTADAGFVAASEAMTGMWAYSVICGLLLAEVNLNTLSQLGRTGATVMTMAERTLGSAGSKAVGASYLFLHCAMLVAYIARAGEIISEVADISTPAASVGFAGGLALLGYSLKPNIMDALNSVLVAAVVLTFLGLLATAAPGVDPEALLKADYSAVPKTLPVLSLAFVFHNIVPVISTSLEGNASKIRTAIIAGTALPLLMFLAWDAAILGSLGSSDAATDPLKILAETNPFVGTLIQSFSFLAVATSFIGFLFGLTSFLGDLMNVSEEDKSPLPFIAAVLPPTLLALSYPDIFFQALDYAGTYGVLLLFGLVPAAMAWSERYGDTGIARVRMVPGGKAGLIAVGGVAAGIIGNQAYESLSSLLHL